MTDMKNASLREPLALRRILFSLLVALVAAAVAGGALGFAAASDGDDATTPDDVPREFGLPEPYLGDVVVQSVTYDPAAPDAAPSPGGHAAKASHAHGHSPWSYTMVERHTWSRTEPVVARDGEARSGLVRLEEYGLENVDHQERTIAERVFDAATRHVVLARLQGKHSESFDGEPSGLPTFTASGSSQFFFRSTSWADDAFGQRSCLVFNELQGRTADLSQDVALFRDCQLPGDAAPVEGPRLFRAVGEGTVGERTAVVLAEVRDGDVPSDARRVWLSADVPYPVHFEASRAEGEPGGQGTYTVTLTDFARGTGPLPFEGDPGKPLPPLVLKALTAWTIDDTGITHPFPLSHAYEAARADPAYGDLRAFLDAHPAARVVEADYQEQATNGGDRGRSWTYVLHDGGDTLVVCSTQTQRHGPEPASWQLPLERPAVTEVRHATCDSDRAYHGPAQFPSELPSVASLFDRWRRVAGPDHADHAPNAYGFSIDCEYGRHDSHACIPRLDVHAGHSIARVENGRLGIAVPVADDAYVSDWQMSLLGVDPDGALRSYFELGIRSQFDLTTGGPGPPAPTGGQGEAIVVQTQRTSTSPWEVPAGPYAVSTGLAALLAGLAYWLWPAVKGALALPLFSRVERPRALDHAARAEIHALVQANPGIHAEEIVRRTGRGRGDVQHHLGKLVDVGLLAKVQGPGFTCYHVPGEVDQRVAAALPALKSQGARAVLAAVAARPGATGTDVAAATGLTRQAVHLHVARLAEAGLVAMRRDGRMVRVTPTALAAQVAAA